MIRVQVIAPSSTAEHVVELLAGEETVTNLVRLPNAAQRPKGDVVTFDVAREEASAIVGVVRETGVLDAGGAISLSETIAELSDGGIRAAEAAEGSEDDGVIWELVDQRVASDAALSAAFLGLLTTAACIGAMALLEQSQILMVGAMVVGPEYAAIAGIVVAIVRRRPAIGLRSLRTLSVGIVAAVAAAALLIAALRLTGVAPTDYAVPPGPVGSLVASPTWATLVVALLAGVAGIVAMTTPHGGALVGVLVSVATVPSLAGTGAALAYLDLPGAGAAALQFLANVAGLVGAGIVTLAVQRQSFARRYQRHQASRETTRARAIRSALGGS